MKKGILVLFGLSCLQMVHGFDFGSFGSFAGLNVNLPDPQTFMNPMSFLNGNQARSGYTADDVVRAMEAVGYKNVPNARQRAQILVDAMNTKSWYDGEKEMFLANIAIETGGLRSLEEAPWDKRPATSSPYYNRNTGHSYHGRGYIQVTGILNHKDLGQKMGLDLVNNPEVLLDERTGAKAAVVFWKSNVIQRFRNHAKNQKRRDYATAEPDVNTATKYVNGNSAPATRLRDTCRFYHIMTQTLNPAKFRTLSQNECN